MKNSNAPYLQTIGKDGKPPESRLNDPRAVSQIVDELVDADQKRSRVNSEVAGLINGNPPFRQSELVKHGQGFRSNFNDRVAEAFVDVAVSGPWDAVSESPTYATVLTKEGDGDQKQDWSEIITEELQCLNKADPCFTYMFQQSQYDMIVFGKGPVIFDDLYDYRAKPRRHCDVKVPRGTKSNVDEWKIATVLVDYAADDLYAFIRNPKAATAVGWDVETVRKVLMEAVPLSVWPNRRRNNWEWLEQQMRNNDIYYSQVCESIPIAHVFYREFPKAGETEGKVSQCTIVEGGQYEKFLFRKVGRYENWRQAIHPFYLDIGTGEHHSVKGIGIRAFGALATLNRLSNHLMDAAFFGSSLHFQARDGVSMENLACTPMGPYIWHQAGAEYLPTVQLGTALEGPMKIKQDTLNQLTSNLAQYRQGMSINKPGNPPTARQIDYEAQNQSVIGRSAMTRYFEQLDPFHAERYRRITNPKLTESNPGGKEALEFIKRCKKRGVPEKAIRNVEYVRATRTVGYGSADARMQSLMRLLSRITLYDEDGRYKILEDVTAADVGHSLMRRYIKPQDKANEPTEQHSQAQDKVGLMKEGMMPMVTPQQNPVIYAQVYLVAAAQAAQSLQQGADPATVYSFLKIAGAAIIQQLQRFANDPSRKQQFQALKEQWDKLAKVADDLEHHLQQQQEEQQQLAQSQNGQMSKQQLEAQQAQFDMALKARESQVKMGLKEREKTHSMSLKQRQADQKAAISDTQTAVKIMNQARETNAKLRNQGEE